MKSTHTLIQYQQHGPTHWKTTEANVIVEAPVSLTVNGRPWHTFKCTPHDLEALAIGFLFTEGVIESMADIAMIEVCPECKSVDVWLHSSVSVDEHWPRPAVNQADLTTTLDQTHLSVADGVKLAPEVIQHLLRQLFEGQSVYPETSGVHVSALSDGQRICISAEDLDWHNTLDKIAGQCLLDRLVMSESVLLTTGRISSDMLRKAARMGTSIVISRTSPTSLAITLAEQGGITLIGYARHDRFNVYTHPWRIVPSLSEFEHWQKPARVATV